VAINTTHVAEMRLFLKVQRAKIEAKI